MLARGVYLTAEQEGIFSDNYFDLLPGEVKTVQFSQRRGAGAGVETGRAAGAASRVKAQDKAGAGAPDFVPAAPQGLEIRSMADYVK